MALKAFWTIVMEGRPTAFRSPRREELLPTLKQLQSRHPDTHLMWFASGRYWRSPDDASGARRPSISSGSPELVEGRRRGAGEHRGHGGPHRLGRDRGRSPSRGGTRRPRAPRKGRAR